jgi:2,3-dihydroxybenzoate---[aryl-carrier protein] ligase
VLEGCTPWPGQAAERYRRHGWWTGEVLGSLLREPARRDPDRIAVVAGGRRFSYGELDARADTLAAGLVERGLGPGQRVVVQLPNSVDFVLVCIALFRIGALPVLALPAHRRAEISYLCQYSRATALVVPDSAPGIDFSALARSVLPEAPTVREVFVAGEAAEFTALDEVSATARELPEPDPSDVAFFLLSGGTTGMPKLIPRTHDDYAFQLRATAAEMGFDANGCYLAVVPVAHNAALGCPGVLGALRAGGRAVLAGSPSPDEVFGLVRAEQVTLTTVMPSILPLWTDTAEAFGADLSAVTIEVGGASLAPEVARRVRPALGATLSHWFGMAEGVLCFTRPGDGDEAAATSQGRPLCPDDEYRVVDAAGREVPPGTTGELQARGPCTLRGYYDAAADNARAFTPDGFLRTGDEVRIDTAGRLVVTGRLKDIVNRGGEKISCDEVEAHLNAHPAVRAVAVVAMPDRVLGERSHAVVVPSGPAPKLAELRAFLTERGLAAFKLPDRLHVMASLPQTGVGKLDRRAVRQALAEPASPARGATADSSSPS